MSYAKKEEGEKSEQFPFAHVNHSNAAWLLGFSIDHGLHFVLEYSPNGSLASMLFGSKQSMDWKIRYKVAIGIG